MDDWILEENILPNFEAVSLYGYIYFTRLIVIN